MKRVFLLIISLVFLFGCGKEEIIQESSYTMNKEYYKVFSPYKVGVSNNYIDYKVKNKTDINEMKLSLMRLSTNYFSENSYYYEEGQYLTKETIKDLLSPKRLNASNQTEIEGITISPVYINYIEEQNYLDKNGILKGISVALSLNKYQYYNENSYVILEEEEIINHGKVMTKELLKYLRSIEELKDIDIMIALYMEAKPDSSLPGNYQYITVTNTDEITEFTKLNEKYYLLTSNALSQEDNTLYKSFESAARNINKYLDTFTAISGRAFYINNNLAELKIDINLSNDNSIQILGIAQYTSDQIVESFSDKVYTEVKINSNYNLKALLIRNKNEFNPKIYILN